MDAKQSKYRGYYETYAANSEDPPMTYEQWLEHELDRAWKNYEFYHQKVKEWTEEYKLVTDKVERLERENRLLKQMIEE